MTKGPIKNMAASVRQRLMNVSKATNRRFSDVLQHYALERWLFRLSLSKYRDQCFLKGALLFVVWKIPATRPTRDIDLLARMNNDLESVRKTVAEICEVSVADDGLIFDSASVATEQIAEDAVYEGVRAKFQGKLGNARIAMQVDIGFSDVVTPAPAKISYPTTLEQPPAELLAYNRETAIAEKFEAMVKLGELNSRMKDFFDVALLAENFDFAENALAAAIRATFDRRGTEVQSDPICFSGRFARDPTKGAMESIPAAQPDQRRRGIPCGRLSSSRLSSSIGHPDGERRSSGLAVAGRRALAIGRAGPPSIIGQQLHTAITGEREARESRGTRLDGATGQAMRRCDGPGHLRAVIAVSGERFTGPRRLYGRFIRRYP